MTIKITLDGQDFAADLHRPLDIGIALRDGLENPNCFYAPPVSFSPLRAGDFVGSIAAGASVNFYDVAFNPHGNGTHTECVGHISPRFEKLNDALQTFHFLAYLVTFYPIHTGGGDRIIEKWQLEAVFADFEAQSLPPATALVVRTMPNDDWKPKTNHSGANPPYFSAEAIKFIVEKRIEHLLIDLPSLDREEDGGKLAGHKTFWQFSDGQAAPMRQNATITELIYVKNDIKDGFYLLNLQIPSFMLDAAPSKPVLYSLKRIKKA